MWIGDKAEKVPKAQEAKEQQQIRPRKAQAVDPARRLMTVNQMHSSWV